MSARNQLRPAYTPGTWMRSGNQIVSLHRDADGKHETLICDVFDEHAWWQQNARLIEAAPKLLAALQAIAGVDGDLSAEEMRAIAMRSILGLG